MFIPLVNQAVMYNNMYITTAGMRYNLEDNYMSCFFFSIKIPTGMLVNSEISPTLKQISILFYLIIIRFKKLQCYRW